MVNGLMLLEIRMNLWLLVVSKICFSFFYVAFYVDYVAMWFKKNG